MKSFLKEYLRSYPLIYFTWLKMLNRGYKDRICKKNTDIVIEGFPRSANSFFVNALLI